MRSLHLSTENTHFPAKQNVLPATVWRAVRAVFHCAMRRVYFPAKYWAPSAICRALSATVLRDVSHSAMRILLKWLESCVFFAVALAPTAFSNAVGYMCRNSYLFVCMYVCVYVCIYVLMYLYMCICVILAVALAPTAFSNTVGHMCRNSYMCVCMCVCVCVCVCMYIRIDVSMYVYMCDLRCSSRSHCLFQCCGAYV